MLPALMLVTAKDLSDHLQTVTSWDARPTSLSEAGFKSHTVGGCSGCVGLTESPFDLVCIKFGGWGLEPIPQNWGTNLKLLGLPVHKSWVGPVQFHYILKVPPIEPLAAKLGIKMNLPFSKPKVRLKGWTGGVLARRLDEDRSLTAKLEKALRPRSMIHCQASCKCPIPCLNLFVYQNPVLQYVEYGFHQNLAPKGPRHAICHFRRPLARQGLFARLANHASSERMWIEPDPTNSCARIIHKARFEAGISLLPKPDMRADRGFPSADMVSCLELLAGHLRSFTK